MLKSSEYARIIPSRPSLFAQRSAMEEAHNNMSCAAYPQSVEVHHVECAYFIEDPPLIFEESKVNDPQEVALICEKCSNLSQKLPQYLDTPEYVYVEFRCGVWCFRASSNVKIYTQIIQYMCCVLAFEKRK